MGLDDGDLPLWHVQLHPGCQAPYTKGSVNSGTRGTYGMPCFDTSVVVLFLICFLIAIQEGLKDLRGSYHRNGYSGLRSVNQIQRPADTIGARLGWSVNRKFGPLCKSWPTLWLSHSSGCHALAEWLLVRKKWHEHPPSSSFATPRDGLEPASLFRWITPRGRLLHGTPWRERHLAFTEQCRYSSPHSSGLPAILLLLLLHSDVVHQGLVL